MEQQEKIKAELLGTRVIVWNEEAGRSLYSQGFFGKPVGIKKTKTFDFSRPLELSLLESLYLLEEDMITLVEVTNQQVLGPDEFSARCVDLFKNFRDLYAVYKHLRGLSYVVRPGLKFGSDFTIYKKGPGLDHAAFMVQVVTGSNSNLEAIHLVRAGRLATSVKKRYVIATVLPDGVKYYIFKWAKP
ncbi:MAG: tRNA-intron lyase [Candidatus Hodarchaeales archaeon]|jgi:tRNA-intron endonuclease